jgi:glucose-6-phosphate 1-epimerase
MTVDYSRFAIGDTVRVVAGPGGLPMVEVNIPAARAEMSPYAGQVLSWTPAGQAADVMFLSKKAFYADGKAIKGGVPVCWPWFGPDPEGKGRPGHGFVRNRMWTLRRTEMLADGRALVAVGMTDDDTTRAVWPHAFDLELTATIGATLTVAMTTRNTGDESFALSQAFHTYFRVGAIDRTTVRGLEGMRYIDKMDGSTEKTQDGAVAITGETDRIYTGLGGPLAIEDAALGRTIRIRTEGSRSAVVWNPWAATAAAMADLEDEDYTRMICVETCNAGPDTLTLAPGASHTLVAEYSVG